MPPNRELKSLAERIAERHRGDRPGGSYLLLLGAGCSATAGVPNPVALARSVFEDLAVRDPEMAAQFLPGGRESDPEALREGLDRYLASRSRIQRSRILQPFYSRLPIPLSYQDLAVLIKEGYFRHVLTTNFDSLLEQALDAIGLRRGVDYAVDVPGALRRGPRDPRDR